MGVSERCCHLSARSNPASLLFLAVRSGTDKAKARLSHNKNKAPPIISTLWSDCCSMISSAKQQMNPIRLIVAPASQMQVAWSCNKGQKSFLLLFVACNKDGLMQLGSGPQLIPPTPPPLCHSAGLSW
ncbi:unnamed protein product [Natator depressus]